MGAVGHRGVAVSCVLSLLSVLASELFYLSLCNESLKKSLKHQQLLISFHGFHALGIWEQPGCVFLAQGLPYPMELLSPDGQFSAGLTLPCWLTHSADKVKFSSSACGHSHRAVGVSSWCGGGLSLSD